jgi:hypothetical protein
VVHLEFRRGVKWYITYLRYVIAQIAAPAKTILSTCAGTEQRLTDVIMFNSRNLGALIVAEEPHVKSWEDGQYNIQNMSIEEPASASSRKATPWLSRRTSRSARIPGLSLSPDRTSLARGRAG